MLGLDAAVVSCTGPRPDNQDSAVAGPRLVAVADGVGGNVGGSIASALVANWLAPLGYESSGAPALEEVVRGANARIAAAVETRPRLRTMATTLVAVLADESGLTLAHIGDSRAYLLRAGRLRQVTRDHTLVQHLLDGGEITPAEAAVHPQRSVVYAALHGDPANVAALEVAVLEALPGDRLLLCSDGLSDVVPLDRLERLLAVGEPPAPVADGLARTALAAGTRDNVTVVVADVTTAAPARAARPATAGAAAHPQPEVTEALEALWPAAVSVPLGRG